MGEEVKVEWAEEENEWAEDPVVDEWGELEN